VLKQNYHEYEAELKAKIQATGASRVIFADCDSRNAFALGQSLGLVLFQGSFIDKL
jgi:hypothetical protein